MKKGRQCLVLVLFLLATACGKEKLEIGRENPEKEIEKCTALSRKKVYDKAIECLEIFKSRFSQSRWGQKAELQIADTYFNQGQYLMAAESYQTFVNVYPAHRQVDYALFRTGLSYLNYAPKAIDRDQKYVREAIGEFQKLLRHFPESQYQKKSREHLNRAETKIARRFFYIGNFYYRTGEYKAAIPRLEDLVQEYPRVEEAPRALFLLVKANLKLGEREKAREAVQELLEKHPKNHWTKRGQETYLRSLNRPEG